MKKIFLVLIIVCSLFVNACSSDNDSGRQIEIPEKFDIKVEVNGVYYVPTISISINSTRVKEWKNEELSFTGEYTYFTTGNEISSTSCKCIKISAWAYLSELNGLESFNLYVDGKLVDTKNLISPPTNEDILTPTVVQFTYKP